jgi:hypothetical protein
VLALIKDISGLSGVFHEAGELGITKGACEFKESVARTVDLTAIGVWNVILPKTQSISGLFWVSQLCPRMMEQLESNCVR